MPDNIEKLHLQSLLEVSQAINNNETEERLFKIFHFICRSSLRFKHFAFVAKEEEELVIQTSHSLTVTKEMLLGLGYLDIEDGKTIAVKETGFKGRLPNLDYVVPVTHKSRLLAYVLISFGRDELHDMSEISFITTLGSVLMVAIENKRLARKEAQNAALRREVEIASKVQELLLPKSLPDNKNSRIKVSYFPHKSVGGDYYDYFPISDDEAIFCVADVSGKGIPAALLMSHCQAVFRTFLRLNDRLDDLVVELNHQILLNSEGMHFATFFIAKINYATNTIQYINAGHNAPMLFSEKGMEELTSGSTVLGALDDLPFINVGETVYKPGDLILAYTDGVTETKNDEEEDFGEERLKELLYKRPNRSLEFYHDYILDHLNAYRGKIPFPDDLTIFTMRLN